MTIQQIKRDIAEGQQMLYTKGDVLNIIEEVATELTEPINEEELNELANKIYPCWCSSENVNCDICIHPKLIEAFKNGCRKAKELLTHNDPDPSKV